MKNTRTRKYIKSDASEGIVVGAAGQNKSFAENLNEIYSTLGSLSTNDGQKPKVSSIKFHLRIYSRYTFGICPIVVQTAGAFTDTVDIDSYNIDEILDSAVDDVFGYQVVSPCGLAKRVPTDDSTAVGLNFGIQRTVEIPGNILQIINREVESERLQALIFGFVGFGTMANQTLNFERSIEIDYVGVSKKIILR